MDTELMDTELFKKLLDAVTPKWEPAPAGSKCHHCNSENLKRAVILMGGPYSGSVRCDDCGFVESVMSYLGKACLSSRPMTEDEILESKMREALE